MASSLVAQNTKPIPTTDTINVKVNDSAQINLLANDRDAQGDPMRLTKFWKYNTPTTMTTLVNITVFDTGQFVFNRAGLFKVKMFKPGTYRFSYVVNDNKAGGGKTGYVVINVTGKIDTAFLRSADFYRPVVYFKSPQPCVNVPGGKSYAYVISGSKFMYGSLVDTSSSILVMWRYLIRGDVVWTGYPEQPTSQKESITWTMHLSRELYIWILTNACKQ